MSVQTYREHCRRMAAGACVPECPSQQPRPIGAPWNWKPPACPGCVSERDRELFKQLADEADEYLKANR